MTPAALMLWSAAAVAHTGAPAAITLTQGPAHGQWELVWEHPMDQTGPGELATPCGSPAWTGPERAADRLHWRTTLWCDPPQDPQLRLAAQRPTTAIVRALPLHGRSTHVLLDLGTDPTLLPPPAPLHTTLLRYLHAGARHVMRGVDHILLLVGLGFAAVRMARPHRATALTVAAFGLGHAVTVVILGMGLLRPPVAWCEGAIATTLVLLGAQMWHRTAPLTWRWAGACGLIHGLGFGSGLADLGLPLHQRLLALLGFNAGVDVAQAAISVATVAALSLPVLSRHRARLSAGLSVLISTVGFAWLWAFWTG